MDRGRHFGEKMPSHFAAHGDHSPPAHMSKARASMSSPLTPGLRGREGVLLGEPSGQLHPTTSAPLDKAKDTALGTECRPSGSFSNIPSYSCPLCPLVQTAAAHPRLWRFCLPFEALQGLPRKSPPTSWKLLVLYCYCAFVYWVTSSVENSACTDPFPGLPGNSQREGEGR